MLRISQIKLPVDYGKRELLHKISRQLKIDEKDILSFTIMRESLDARKKSEIHYQLTVDVTLSQEDVVLKRYRKKNPKDNKVEKMEPVVYKFPECGEIPLEKRPVIVGMGPAGLYCGYYLALRGFRPILLERGVSVEKRKKSIDKFWETGVLDTESNVQFGEGGAGTFSDGKLNTLIKDKVGRNREALKVFVKMGAKEEILYQQKPHLGTDKLLEIVRNLREEIISLGGEVHFETKLERIMIKDGKLCGCMLSDGKTIETDVCVLATGHSARDTFEMLQSIQVTMEPKSFAVGFRIQHPQEMISRLQYGDMWEKLPAADYKVTAQTSGGRGVYSFCMCPGGYVVNASSENGMLAVNGMSYSGRDGKNANSAMIISVTPTDFDGKDALCGVRFQKELEQKAYQLAEGKIPIQLYGDFVNNQASTEAKDVSVEVKGQYAFCNLRGVLPIALEEAFMEGMEQIGQRIKGFDREDAVLAGVESRTSSPVRITRDENLVSSLAGLYPCGEGAGYAGGITSAAVDGIRVAEAIVKKYCPDSL